MSTNYPSAKDDNTSIPVESTGTPLSTNHIESHTNVRSAIIALETKVGVDGDATTTSHDYKLSEVTGSDKAVAKTGAQTLEDKTLGSGTKVALGSDATGDMYYRDSNGDLARLAKGNTNDILTQGATIPEWTANPATTDASTTERGVVEKATAAEINAGTATGGAGTLAVTPDGLASSDYKTESEINTLISTAIGNEPINSSSFTRAYKSDGTIDGIQSNGLWYVNMADSTDTDGYASVFVPNVGTLDSIQVVFYSGNTTGTVVLDYEFIAVADGSKTTDSLTGDTMTDEQPNNTPIFHTVPSTAYNGLTRGQIWNFKVTRKGSDGSDNAATTVKFIGIKVNIS